MLDELRQTKLRVSLAPRPKTDVDDVHVENALLKVVQNKHVSIKSLTSLGLSPFEDSNGIVRVGGRLKYSWLPFDQMYPVVVPKESPLAERIIAHIQLQVKHQGHSITLAAVHSAGFFIITGRSLVDKYIKSCKFVAACVLSLIRPS